MVCLEACQSKQQIGLCSVMIGSLTKTAKQSCIFYSGKGLLFRASTGSGRDIGSSFIKTRWGKMGWIRKFKRNEKCRYDKQMGVSECSCKNYIFSKTWDTGKIPGKTRLFIILT